MITLPYDKVIEKYHMNQVVYEGWEIRDLIEELEPGLDHLMDWAYAYNGGVAMPAYKTRAEIENHIRVNIQHTTKGMRYVNMFFIDKYNGMKYLTPEGTKILKLK